MSNESNRVDVPLSKVLSSRPKGRGFAAYRMTYHCEACEIVWGEEWSCACNDKCPGCNREIEPCDIEEVEE